MSKYTSFAEIEGLLDATPYFDPEWYVRHNSITLAPDQTPEQHFRDVGWAAHLQPSFYFSPRWYLSKYPDIKRAGMNPYSHFLLRGINEDREAAEFVKSGELTFDASKVRQIVKESGLFSSEWYVFKNKDVAGAGIDPLSHFNGKGYRENRTPNPIFDLKFYKLANSDLEAFGWNPLLHYIFVGSLKDRSPNALFSHAWYSTKYGPFNEDRTPLADFLLHLDDRDPSPFLNSDWYLKTHPDAAGYPGGPLKHYLEIGFLEGRDPSPDFDTNGYINANMDVKASKANPLVHFLLFGQKEGRAPKPEARNRQTTLFRVGVPEYGPFEQVFSYDRKVVGSPKIAVHLHLFYPELSEELADYLANIPIDFDLYISVPKSVNDLLSIEAHFRMLLPNVDLIDVWHCENRGRDMAPLFVDLADEILKYDLLCHLHSKRSAHNFAHGDWRRFLCHHILGSEELVRSILNQFETRPGLGLLHPPYHGALRSQPNWGKNRAVVDAALDRIGLEYTGDVCPDYPAGSFLWVRPPAIAPILTAKLTLDEFAPEEGQLDGTFAHALERLLGIVPLTLGYQVSCISVDVAHNLTSYYHPKRLYKPLERDRTEDILQYRASRKNKGRGRTAVCTAVFGDFDTLLLPEVLEDDCDYYCFSDNQVDGYGVFNIIQADYRDPDPRRSARYVKTHLTNYCVDYENFVWVDANVLIRRTLQPYLDMLGGDISLAAIAHPLRETCFEEASICKEMKLDEADLINEQVRRYVTISELASSQLIETNFFCFLGQRKEIREMFRVWWTEMDRFSRRDQIGINYAIFKSGVNWKPVFADRLSLRDAPDFCLFEHGMNKWPGRPLSDQPWYRPARVSFAEGAPLDRRRGAKDKTAAKRSGVREPTVDIVVCVHNALDDVLKCIRSLVDQADHNFRLILVDDASDKPTKLAIERFQYSWLEHTILPLAARGGYTRAVNAALRQSKADAVVLLNSDTLVPPTGIRKLRSALFSSDARGIVGPLSNAASYQSVPSVKGAVGQTAINPLPEGMTVHDLDQHLEASWNGIYPLTPLVHGFCLCIRRAVLEAIGEFDESAFPFGYGEENDFCFRAADAGFELAIATNTYVFHAKSKSYSDAERTKYMEAGAEALFKKHSKRRVKAAVKFMEENPLLNSVRSLAAALFDDKEKQVSQAQAIKENVSLGLEVVGKL
ncbi:glycosyltransferase [Bradyrhizobium sp. CCGUVB1N3]|uniref:rhamnan synthesis F family protein n=1 Tax=Bradyrhizobium sp. CCGUVB1N3 TaxID=2949629 RepID=UPI0020B1A275|nr:rhamnan synthesis F family protein [Bradyrhizobium sp. CCGUVB1N3]MCP3476610.1 glycosyltransferase [Bradyrhizobium sp. CCGUVB1N3]